jgi:transposase
MRTGISISVSAADLRRLAALVSDPKTPQKHVWRARIILLTADGVGTTAIMSATGKSKTCVWRWQERFMEAGVDGLPRDKTPPPGKAIIDNYATHKTPEVRRWLARHPRWTFHFTPTSSSWLNAVEGFFAKLTRRRLKHGVFHSVVDLQAAINRCVEEHIQAPKPFAWKANPDETSPLVHEGSKRWSQSTRSPAQAAAVRD